MNVINIKKDFPILKANPKLVYLDNASTSQKPQVVIDRLTNFYTRSNASIKRGLYSMSEEASKEYEDTRELVAKFINAQKEDIVFTKNTTEALNLVAFGLNITKGDNIVVTELEHHSNFVPWQRVCDDRGASFRVSKINDGLLDLDNLFSLIDKKTKVVAISQISNVLGNINDISSIIKKIRQINPSTIIVVDAAQSAAYKMIDVVKMDCDFLAFSAHKMLGPFGVGVLYGKELKELEPRIFGGGMIKEVGKVTTFADLPDRLEAGTVDVASVIAFGEAIKYLNKVSGLKKYIDELTEYALAKLKELDSIVIYGPKSKDRIGVISLNINGLHAHDLAQFLAENNIAVRAGHHCAMPLHKSLGVSATLRISFNIYNDKSDIDKLITNIIKAIKFFKHG